MKRLTVGQLIEELQRFDKDKLVYIDDETNDLYSTLEGVYTMNSPYRAHLHGEVYLAKTDE